MKKEIQIPIYPRKMWLIDRIEDLDGFTFVLGGGECDECSESKADIEEGIIDSKYRLLTHAVIDNNTSDMGVLVYVNPECEGDVSAFAHEAVHVADYVFDELNMTTQSYIDGNEPYAYLVGWVAEKLCEYYDDRRKQESVED